MANPNQSEKSVALDREENITRGNLSAKKVALYTYNSDTDQLEPYTGGSAAASTDGATESSQIEQEEILNQILSAISAIAGAKGIAADLRVTLLGGTTAVTGTLTAVTTVTTVTTLTGITNIGAQPATTFLPNQQNQTAILSNINNVSV